MAQDPAIKSADASLAAPDVLSITDPPVKKSVPGEQPLGSPGGIFGQGNKPGPPTPTPQPQQDVNAYMKTYIDELTRLGPEYQAEMNYLAPYMTSNPGAGLEDAVAKEYGGSGVKEITGPTPQGEALGAASAANAQAIESFKPGFGNIAKGVTAAEQTVPYADVLNSVLAAQKNEMLYGSTPNFSAIQTNEWGPSQQALYGYLTSSAGGGSSIGVNPATASTQLTIQQEQQANATAVAQGQTAPYPNTA
jgi:hypothetical protein